MWLHWFFRHDKGVVSIQSNGSGRSSPGMLQKLDGSVSGLDWDPYEPLQHSSDNLGLPPVPFTNCSSTTVNVDLNHNRSDFPSYHLTSHDRSHSTNSSSKFADPMKKQFTVKQKGVLLKFQVIVAYILFPKRSSLFSRNVKKTIYRS